MVLENHIMTSLHLQMKSMIAFIASIKNLNGFIIGSKNPIFYTEGILFFILLLLLVVSSQFV